MNISRETIPLTLFNKWHGIFYMPGRTGKAGHTSAFDNPVTEDWGKAEMFSSCGSLSLSRGFTPSRHLRPCSGQEHTIV